MISELEIMAEYSKSASSKSTSSFSKRKHPSTIREELEPCIKHCKIYCEVCGENNLNPFRNPLKRQISANDLDRGGRGNRGPGKLRKTLSVTGHHATNAKISHRMDNEVLFQIIEFLLEDDPQVKATIAWDMLSSESKDEYIKDFLKRQLGKIVINRYPDGNDNSLYLPQEVKFASSRENENFREVVEQLCNRVEELQLIQEKSGFQGTKTLIERPKNQCKRSLRETRFGAPSTADLLNPEEPMTDGNSGLEHLRLWSDFKSINLKVEELTDQIQRLKEYLPPKGSMGNEGSSTDVLLRPKPHTAVQQKLGSNKNSNYYRSFYVQVEDSPRKDGTRSNHNLISYITSKSRQFIRRLRRRRRIHPPLGMYRSPHPNITPNRSINPL